MILIGWLSIHSTVRSQGDPLWKPFNCELIDLIVLKVPELLWYYRTCFAVSLWVNNELIDKMLQFRDRREQQDNKIKKKKKTAQENENF